MNTTRTYQIRTIDLDTDFGQYQGDSPEAALDAMARDVGYASYAEACATGEMSANCRAELVTATVDGIDAIKTALPADEHGGYPTEETSAIQSLKREAVAAGDQKQVDLCNLALDGDVVARAACLAAIDDAAAMEV